MRKLQELPGCDEVWGRDVHSPSRSRTNGRTAAHGRAVRRWWHLRWVERTHPVESNLLSESCRLGAPRACRTKDWIWGRGRGWAQRRNAIGRDLACAPLAFARSRWRLGPGNSHASDHNAPRARGECQRAQSASFPRQEEPCPARCPAARAWVATAPRNCDRNSESELTLMCAFAYRDRPPSRKNSMLRPARSKTRRYACVRWTHRPGYPRGEMGGSPATRDGRAYSRFFAL